MSISYNEGLNWRLSAAGTLEEMHDRILRHFHKEGYGAGLYFTGDDEMALLNLKYRGKEGPTDVLSFPLSDDNEMTLGEIIISVETAEKQAEGTLDEEVRELFVHGMLHLLGYDHETDTDHEIMNGFERKFLDTHE